MLVGDMFLDKRRGFKKFLARFASELALIFLLDERFHSFS